MDENWSKKLINWKIYWKKFIYLINLLIEKQNLKNLYVENSDRLIFWKFLNT